MLQSAYQLCLRHSQPRMMRGISSSVLGPWSCILNLQGLTVGFGAVGFGASVVVFAVVAVLVVLAALAYGFSAPARC